jgi:hypothetical protein
MVWVWENRRIVAAAAWRVLELERARMELERGILIVLA